MQLENGNEEILDLPPSTTSISQFLNDTPREMGNNMDVSDMPQEHIDIDEELSYREVLDNFDHNQPSVEREAPNKSTESGKRKMRTTERSSNQRERSNKLVYNCKRHMQILQVLQKTMLKLYSC